MKKKKQVSTFQKILNATPEYTKAYAGDGYFVIKWGIPGTGFGEVSFGIKKDGSVEIQTECMGPKFVKKILGKLVDGAKIVE